MPINYISIYIYITYPNSGHFTGLILFPMPCPSAVRQEDEQHAAAGRIGTESPARDLVLVGYPKKGSAASEILSRVWYIMVNDGKTYHN